ncbi:hypothetical protein RJT34_03196 [Clitoria ternatea]|uniref:Uncharacterized protein n=1 Tax=Clitoria ternatea TaxID=43366 RepID=A0AAN9KJV7_CLITE
MTKKGRKELMSSVPWRGDNAAPSPPVNSKTIPSRLILSYATASTTIHHPELIYISGERLEQIAANECASLTVQR